MDEVTVSDSNESSYYEVALTNRQVLVCFVVLLGSVLGAFLSGVWVGRSNRSEGFSAAAGETENGQAVPDQVEKLEEFKFADQKPAYEPLDRPDLSQLLEQPKGDTTLAQDVGSAPPPPPSPPPPSPPPPSPPPRQRPPPEKTPPPPLRAAPPEVGEGFVLQVFSGRDEGQARKVLATVKGDGYKAYLSSIQKGAMTLYRVRIGPFAERAAAEKAEREVKGKHKFETWVAPASS